MNSAVLIFRRAEVWCVVALLLVASQTVCWWYWPKISNALSRAISRAHWIEFEGVEIRGSEQFVRQVEAALKLLREKSPKSFVVVQQYVKRIREHSRSGMRAYADPPTFDLASKTAYYSLTWCSGAIAHDAFHSKLYHDYRDAHGEPVPYDAWCGQAKELECNNFQLIALKEIAAPEYEVHYLRTLDGSHFDTDGDGKETWNDYWRKDW